MIPAETQPRAAPPEPHFVTRAFIAMLVSGALTLGSFLWQGNYGFNLEDEGFLWYGVQRVLSGDVPIRDFMAYDLGRYYWSAALMGMLRNDGIMALRAAVAVFQFIGLFVTLLLLSRGRSRNDVVLFILAAITILAWMYPRHKLFDISLSVILIGILAFLVQSPSRGRFFLAGVGVGLVAVFGRNHGVYGLAGILNVIIYLACNGLCARRLVSALACCVFGIVVGYLPNLVAVAAIPGFAEAFWESIRTMLDRGATNLPLPVPWPWQVPVAQLPPATAAAELLTGALFIAVVIFGVCSLLWIVRQAMRRNPVAPEFVASAALALPYAHFSFSRADIGHLAQGIFPFLIGAFVILMNWSHMTRWIIASTIAGASLLIMLPLHPGWSCRVNQQCTAADVAGNELRVDLTMAGILKTLKVTVDQYAPNGRNFVVTPLWPGAYAVFGRKSPMWEIYALFPRGNEFQQKEIERIKASSPAFVLVLDIALDGHDYLRFRNSHPVIEQFFRDNFDTVKIGDWPAETFQFYRSR